MLSFKIKGLEVDLSFSFFAIFAVLFLANDCSKVLLPLVCCFIHEFGHIVLMKAFGAPPKNLLFYGGGIKIVPNLRLISNEREIIVLLGGSFLNILIGTLFLRFSEFDTFAAVNLMLGFFNLLPFKAFDGGQIIEKLLSDRESGYPKEAYSVIRKALALIIILFALFLIFRFSINLSLAVTVCYIIVSEVFG